MMKFMPANHSVTNVLYSPNYECIFSFLVRIPKQSYAIPVPIDHTYTTVNRNTDIQDISDVNVTWLIEENATLQTENQMLKVNNVIENRNRDFQ